MSQEEEKNMDNRISLKMRKVKSSAPLRGPYDELYRDEKTAHKYDNSNRKLDVTRTKDNVILAKPETDNYDELRADRIEQLNEKRKTEQIDRGRKLRSDSVDTVEMVVQLSKEYVASKTEDELIQDYTEIYNMMKKHPEDYGNIDCAAIHVDEGIPHLQMMTSALDFENGRSIARDMFGNKTKMSNNQTVFAERCQQAGIDVQRGIQRIGSTYQEQKDEFETKYGYKLTRHNEKVAFDLMAKDKELEDTKEGIEEFKQMAIDDIQMRDSNHKVPEKKLKKKEPNEVPEPIATSTGKEQHQRLTHQQLLTMLRDVRVKQLEEREKEIEEREQIINDKEKEVDNTITEFNEHVNELSRMQKQSYSNKTPNERVGAYLEQNDPELYSDTLISANIELKRQSEKFKVQKVRKPVKKPVRGRNEPQKGFDIEL